MRTVPNILLTVVHSCHASLLATRCRGGELGGPAPSAAAAEDIEGLLGPGDWCDDFVCEGSPSVEAAVRRLGRAVEGGSWRVSGAPLFARGVAYAGPTRRFTGAAGYGEGLLPGLGEGPVAGRVEELKMLSLMEVEIRWSARPGGAGAAPAPAPLRAGGDGGAGAGAGAGPGRVRVRSEFKVNPITGRVEAHRDSWDLSDLPPPARALVAGRQALWGARAGLSEAAAGLSEAVKALLDGDDAGGGDIFVDPRDPGKWVQQEDTVFRDGVFFALVVTILWTFAKALVEIEKLNF